jgi:hypothetical protein
MRETTQVRDNQSCTRDEIHTILHMMGAVPVKCQIPAGNGKIWQFKS